MCVVTLDLQDHRGANPRYVYFFSCWITNRHSTLACVYSVTFANVTPHPRTHGCEYHSGRHASKYTSADTLFDLNNVGEYTVSMD